MVYAHHGQRNEHFKGFGVAHLAGQRLEAASHGELQGQQRSDFADKLEAIVGLYLNPPEHALVLSVDEKSQIQALDRTQPGLPLKKGRGQTMTHDYKRNGTTTLFAALEHRHWRGLRPVPAETSPSGVAEVSAHDRSDHTRRQRHLL
jgi:hypothetical protein